MYQTLKRFANYCKHLLAPLAVTLGTASDSE
jgi:hypothetical protein